MDKDTVTLFTVGDLMICDSPLYASVGVGSKYTEIKGRLFSNCENIFNNADIVIGNFETVVYHPKDRSLKELQMSCSEDVINEIKKAGFSILNLANNHSLQHGTEGFELTRNTLEQYGIRSIGVKNEAPYICEINGIRLAFLAFCIHLEWYQPENVLYEDNITHVIHTVKKLHENDPDLIIIISIHWGDEFAEYPSNAQVALAHKLVDKGANIILGHHSHVYQGIEEYKGSVIAYSQGNFVSDMKTDLTRQTAILKLLIKQNKTIIREIYPFYIDSNFVLQENDNTWFEQRQTKLEKVLEKKVSDDDYWMMITSNHKIVHNTFKTFFIRNLFNYEPRISIRMIFEFLIRKFKKIVGTSTFGRVSSMDSHIRESLEK